MSHIYFLTSVLWPLPIFLDSQMSVTAKQGGLRRRLKSQRTELYLHTPAALYTGEGERVQGSRGSTEESGKCPLSHSSTRTAQFIRKGPFLTHATLTATLMNRLG